MTKSDGCKNGGDSNEASSAPESGEQEVGKYILFAAKSNEEMLSPDEQLMESPSMFFFYHPY